MFPLRLSTWISAADAAIQNKICESRTTALIISYKEMEYIIKILKLIEQSELLIKGVVETFENETKEQNDGFRNDIRSIIKNKLNLMVFIQEIIHLK